MNMIQKQKDAALIVSILLFIAMAIALYSVFLLAGINGIQALVEAIIISSTAITLIILYLFGRIWKIELKGSRAHAARKRAQ